ncbi:MAG: hypothetical protein K6G73_09260 [Marinilabiliaceae bacterium]|nr:hypothetical protein [Marinilabiliaceae bacterium]
MEQQKMQTHAGPPMVFAMPMMRDFVPKPLRPWIYVVFAFCFQLGGGLYLGAINEIISTRQFLLEDVLMCLYCNLAGMAVYFPLLFRMKFHFPNKVLLLGASVGLIVSNIGAAYAPNLPMLWLFCIISGFCKIQGTFECMSNIQLWMTPKRDFRVFFPLLHIFILGAMQVSDYLAAQIAYTSAWENMHWLMSGIYMTIAIVLIIITKAVYIMPPVPLKGIDWISALLWLAFLLQWAFFFCYGQTLDWLHSASMRTVGIAAIATSILIVVRMLWLKQPYIDPQIWRVKHFLPILCIITIAEICFASEHVLEEVFYEHGLEYADHVAARLDWWSFMGVVIGCLFALLWMKVCDFSKLRLVTIAFFALAAYLIIFYNIISSALNIESLRLPLMLRSMAAAIMSIALMTLLHDIFTFQTFFMALSIFNMIHMVIGGVVGAAFYSYGLNYFIADNISRFSQCFDHISMSVENIPFAFKMDSFSHTVMLVSIKQLYGIVAYVCLSVGMLLLLYKLPLRRGFKRMQSWNEVGKRMLKRMARQEKKA